MMGPIEILAAAATFSAVVLCIRWVAQSHEPRPKDDLTARSERVKRFQEQKRAAMKAGARYGDRKD